MESMIMTPADFVLNGECVETCPAVPTKPDHNIRWVERSTTYHLPNVLFSYEATFSNLTTGGSINFGVSIQWQRLPYTLRFTQRYMLYCVVSSVTPDFSNVISKGDIILRINDENMFYQHGDDIPSEEVLAQKLENRKSQTETLRFLRPASNSANAMISPSEIVLYAQDKATTAKFMLKPNKETPPRMVLENISIESNTPAPVRKMMQTSTSSKPQWMSVPVFKDGPMDTRIALGRSIHTNQNSNSTQSNLNNLLSGNATTVIVPPFSVHEKQHIDHQSAVPSSEVYREKNKFVAIFADQLPTTNGESPSQLPVEEISVATSLQERKEIQIKKRKQSSQKRTYSVMYNIGRYDTEEEARKTIQRAQATAELYQTFDPYYFIKEVTKKQTFTIPTSVASLGPTILTINTAAVPSAAAINKGNP